MTLDVETTGNADVTKYGIIALGIFIGDLKGNKLHKSRIHFNTEQEYKYDYDTMLSLFIFMIIGFLFKNVVFPFLLILFYLDKLIVVVDPEKIMEERCLRQFWDKHQDKLKEFKQNTLTRTCAIDSFLNILREYDSKYNVEIVSDNPSFDISFINYYIGKYSTNTNLPLHFNSITNEYRGINDIYEYNLKIDKEVEVKHDHYPENDAEYIYRKLFKA